MAGEWIKMRMDLESDIEVLRLARQFSITPGEVVFTLYRLAGWFNKHGHYGKMEIGIDAIDIFLQIHGFSIQLKSIGWIQENDGVLFLKEFCGVNAVRKSLGRALREKILNKRSCAACGATSGLVIDHDIPVVRGGMCVEENLQALCAPCNRAKGRKTMAEFMAGRARR